MFTFAEKLKQMSNIEHKDVGVSSLKGTPSKKIYIKTSTEAVYNPEGVTQEYINNHVDGSKIVDGTITNNKIADSTISMGKLDNDVQTKIQQGTQRAWNPRGAYNENTVYGVNDLVYHTDTNSSYISLQANNQGHNPAWQSATGGWWMKVLDGSYVNVMVEELEQAIAQAIEDAQEDIDDAIAGANTAAQNANTAAANAEAKIDWVEEQVDSLTAYEVATVLDETSIIPVQNKVVTEKFKEVTDKIEWKDNEIFDLNDAIFAEYNSNYISHAKTETGGRWTASANNTSGNTLYMTIPRLSVGKRYKIKFDYTSTASINNILLGRLPLIVGLGNRVSPTPYQYLKSVGGVPETGQIDAEIYCDNAYVQYIMFTIPATNKNQYFEISNISIIPYSDIKDILAESQYGDFEIADPMGNILALFRNGHIMTRNFNSENLNGSILSKFKGKKIAIVGDSISTYQGWLPSDVPGFVGTAYATYYPHGNVDRVEKTWWYQMAENLGLDPATAIANTSWSGGVVCGDSTSTTNGKPSCSTKRVSDIAIRGFVPDVIIIFISCNDWYQCGLSGYSTTLGDWTIKDPIPAEGTVFKFRNAYALMLAKIRQTYPLSRVFCCTILDDYRRDGISDDDTDNAWPPNDAAGITIAEWNNNIREIAEAFACDVINIHDCGITYFNIQQSYAVDTGLHPNAAGMTLIAQKVTSELIAKY